MQMHYLIEVEPLDSGICFNFYYKHGETNSLIASQESNLIDRMKPFTCRVKKVKEAYFVFADDQLILSVVHNAIPVAPFAHEENYLEDFAFFLPKTKDWSIETNKQLFVEEKDSTFILTTLQSQSKDDPLMDYISRTLVLDKTKEYVFHFESSDFVDYEVWKKEVVEEETIWTCLLTKNAKGRIVVPITEKETVSFRFGKKSGDQTILSAFQLEEGTIAHTYLATEATSQERVASTCTIPKRDYIKEEQGSLFLSFTPKGLTDAILFQSGDFLLELKNKQFLLRASGVKKESKEVSLSIPLIVNQQVIFFWTWEKNNHKIWVQSGQNQKEASNFTGDLFGEFDTFVFHQAPLLNGTYHELFFSHQSFIYHTIESAVIAEAKSNQSYFFDFSNKQQFKQKKFIEGTLAPIDGSPILVSDEVGPLDRTYFFDLETGVYQTENTESFFYTGQERFFVAYSNLDKKHGVRLMTETGERIGEPLQIFGQEIQPTFTEEEKAKWLGETLYLSYQVDRSYVVEMNEDTALDSYKVLLSQYPSSLLSITQEGNRFSALKLAKEIELNPLLNPRHKGFVYITKDQQETQAFRVNVSSAMIQANGFEKASVMIEAIDTEGNEVLSPSVDVFLIDEKGQSISALGQVVPVVNKETLKARNTSGRLYYEYQAPYLPATVGRKTKVVQLVVLDRERQIGCQVPLVLKPSTENLVPQNKRERQFVALPFEVFSRYYERQNIPAVVLDLFDFDKNKQLTAEDFLVFLEKQYDLAFMAKATQILQAWEEK